MPLNCLLPIKNSIMCELSQESGFFAIIEAETRPSGSVQNSASLLLPDGRVSACVLHRKKSERSLKFLSLFFLFVEFPPYNIRTNGAVSSKRD